MHPNSSVEKQGKNEFNSDRRTFVSTERVFAAASFFAADERQTFAERRASLLSFSSLHSTPVTPTTAISSTVGPLSSRPATR